MPDFGVVNRFDCGEMTGIVTEFDNCSSQVFLAAPQQRKAMSTHHTEPHDPYTHRPLAWPEPIAFGPRLLGMALTPLPLFPLQPLLSRIVTDVAQRRPELFERLGPHIASSFVIDVEELPFTLHLQPDPQAPKLTAHRRSERLTGTATITGPFAALFRIIDGDGDSDALFFSRDIRIGGNTEAAVCLRNALDDLDGSIVDDVLEIGGRFFAPLRFVLTRLRRREKTV